MKFDYIYQNNNNKLLDVINVIVMDKPHMGCNISKLEWINTLSDLLGPNWDRKFLKKWIFCILISSIWVWENLNER